MTTDSREQRLPAWTRELLSNLRNQLVSANSDIRQLTEENERLKNLAEEKFTNRDGESNTFLIHESLDQELALGLDKEIRFGSPTFFSVAYTGHRQLTITADGDLQVLPVTSYQVLVKEVK